MSRHIQIGPGYHNVAMPGKGAPVLNEGDTYTVSDSDFMMMQQAGSVGPDAMIVDLGVVADTGGGGTGGISSEVDPIAENDLARHKTSTDHDVHNDARYETHGAVAAHVAILDPHGARAYADSRIAAITGAPPAALDTLQEIAAQMASDETGAASMLASINQNATNLTNETTRATAAEQANTTAINNHVAALAAAHAATAVSFSPAGLVVVTGTNVQAAIAQLDAWAAAHASGNEIASSDVTVATAIAANSTYYTQGQVVVPAGTGPHEVEVIGGVLIQFQTGTQPIGTSLRADCSIFDEANTLVGYSAHHVIQDTAATTKTFQTTLPVKASLPTAAVTKTYTWQVRGTNIAVNGATLSVLIGGAFPARKMVARYR